MDYLIKLDRFPKMFMNKKGIKMKIRKDVKCKKINK